jgi:hypothetical protein
MNNHSIEEHRQIFAALDALSASERMERLANACIECNKTLPTSTFLIILAVSMSSFMSKSERAKLAQYMLAGVNDMLEGNSDTVMWVN